MIVSDVIKDLEDFKLPAGADLTRQVGSITNDSRKASRGDIFVAIKGSAVDGHRFLPSLKDKGLAAIVVEELPDDPASFGDTPIIQVTDTHMALGIMASNFYGRPSKKVKLIGVTGTNGKTTVATLIYEMSRMAGVKAGLLSTIANYIDGRVIPSTHTTPDPVTLNRLLAEMVDEGCRIVAMEVSSHAAHQKRIAGLTFAGGIFTNLTRDHLDYHKDFADYRDAKKSFFDNLESDAFALTNIDDHNGEFMLQNCKASRHTYSLRSKADFEARIIEKRIDSTLISLNGHQLETLFSGVYNIYNLTAVYGAMSLSGFDLEETLVDISRLRPVAGRFQTFKSKDNVLAVIDYAHTPDALENVLTTINDANMLKGKIVTVVGAGGDRDKGKRPQMGSIAASLSDRLILTSDNPRSEEPDRIIDDMKTGMNEAQLKKTLSITDRREAIRTAVALCEPNDIILIAGKGHEDYQEINGIRHPFNDFEEVKKIMNS